MNLKEKIYSRKRELFWLLLFGAGLAIPGAMILFEAEVQELIKKEWLPLIMLLGFSLSLIAFPFFIITIEERRDKKTRYGLRLKKSGRNKSSGDDVVHTLSYSSSSSDSGSGSSGSGGCDGGGAC